MRKKYYYCDKLKGIELPVNALIIVILAVLVLLGILAMYAGVWSPSSGGVNLEAAKDNACHMLASMGCSVHPAAIPVNNFDADGSGKFNPGSSVCGCEPPACTTPGGTQADNLWNLCTCKYKMPQDPVGCVQCMKMCGCEDVNNKCT